MATDIGLHSQNVCKLYTCLRSSYYTLVRYELYIIYSEQSLFISLFGPAAKIDINVIGIDLSKFLAISTHETKERHNPFNCANLKAVNLVIIAAI